MFKEATEYDKLKAEVKRLNMKRSGRKPVIIHQGKTLKQWAEKLNIGYGTANRLYSEGKLSDDYTVKVGPKCQILFEGKNLNEWAEELNVSRGTVIYRLNEKGDPRIKKVITKKQPIKKHKYWNHPALKGKTAIDWSEELGVSRSCIYERLEKWGHPYSKTECKKMGLKLKEKVDK